MKKIVFVVPMLAPYAIARYRELAKNPNIDLHIIVEQDRSEARNGSGWSFEQIEGCHTYLLNSAGHHYNTSNSTAGYQIRENRKYSFGLRKIIREIAPDVVIVCNSTQILFLTGKKKYKLGVVVEDTLRAEQGRKKINRIIKRWLMKRADFFIPFSDDARAFLNKNGFYSPFINSTWSMNVDFFNDLDECKKMEKRKQFGMDQRRSYIMVANLIPRKGVKQFLEGWSKMPRAFHMNSQLFIIGEGPQKSELKEYAIQNKLDNVHILGGMQYKEVSYYLQCGDLFVLPTLEDLCSLSVLEAMAASKPVLTTIYNGARQFVENGENGYIFDSADIESIIDVLNKIDSADIKAMSQCSAKRIEMYTTERVMHKLAIDLLEL